VKKVAGYSVAKPTIYRTFIRLHTFALLPSAPFLSRAHPPGSMQGEACKACQNRILFRKTFYLTPEGDLDAHCE